MATPTSPNGGIALLVNEPELRKEKFARILATKAEQGYDIESQGETEAVIVCRGRRRRFRSPIAGKRQHISIDHAGKTTTHTLDR
jgi:hypothetical protein